MELKELRCKNCGAPIEPDNVVERLAMARCGHCGTVFALDGMPGLEDRFPARERPPVPMPARTKVRHAGGALEIAYRWFHPVALFLLVFALFWNGFMITWHTIALSQGMWQMSLFGIIHTLVGIGLGYAAVAMLVNTTVVRAQYGQISVRSGPLPWPGNKTIPRDQIEQIYTKERLVRSENSVSTVYDVMVVRRDGTHKPLVKNLWQAEQALFIEQQLEQFLGIKDRPIPGELPR